MKTNVRQAVDLFLCFFKIGAFTFGGGYAMIPIIQKEIGEKRGLISDEELLDIVAIAESTPGPIAINAATFVGSKVAGFFGAFCATLGVVLPSFIIISLLSLVLEAVNDLKAVKYAFFGIRAAVLALIVKALWSMYKQCPKHIVSYIVAAGSFVAAALFNVPVIYVILGCALFGLIASFIARRVGVELPSDKVKPSGAKSGK